MTVSRFRVDPHWNLWCRVKPKNSLLEESVHNLFEISGYNYQQLFFCNRYSRVMSQVSVVMQLNLLRPTTDDALPTPPPISLSSYQLVASKSPSVAATAAASGGGLATDEINLEIPVHHTSLEKLEPMLEFLIGCYAVEMVMNCTFCFNRSFQ